MKKILSFLLIILFSFGCKKAKENDPFVLNFQKILERYIVCDSIRTKVNNVSTIQVIGRGQGYDFKFHADASYTIFTNPQIVRYYQLTPPDRLYFYEDIYDPNQYYKITTLTETKLVEERTDDDGKFIIKYCTIEP